MKKIFLFTLTLILFVSVNGQKSFAQTNDLGNKIYIQENGEPKDKLDLLFIPANISDFVSLKIEIENALNRVSDPPGLFNLEPFKNYKDKFNVAYIDKSIDEVAFECNQNRYDGYFMNGKHYFLCDQEKVKKAYQVFEPDYIIIIFDYPMSSSFDLIAHVKLSNLKSHSLTHEFSHYLGLADEYVAPYYAPCSYSSDTNCFANYQKIVSFYPNLDTIGCPKWCSSYNLNQDDVLAQKNATCNQFIIPTDCRSNSCEWFELKNPFFNQNCVAKNGSKNVGVSCAENASCIMGGDYGQLAFNSGASIMGYGENLNVNKFNKASEEHLKLLLECCYPASNSQECQQFRNKFLDIPNDIIPPLKLVYNQISHCGESKSTSCSESDNGKDPNVRGTTQDNFLNVSDSCGLYYPKMLFEYYCSDGHIAYEELKCPYGCRNGACAKEGTQTFSLSPRWNLISLPFFPVLANKIESVLQPLIQSGNITGKLFELWVAKDDYSSRPNTHWTDRWFAWAYQDNESNFFNLDPLKSYFIKTSEPISFSISGSSQNFTYQTWTDSVKWFKGWNMVGFPFESAVDIKTALKPIETQYTKVAIWDKAINGYSYFYNPSMGVPEYLNGFTQFTPGIGYWIKIGE